MLSRPRLFTGVLLDDVSQPQDAWLGVMNPDNGQEAVLYSLGDGRVRAYLGYPRSAGHRLDLRASFGQGPAMALRGVRMLRDHLLAADDWDTAGHACATEQYRSFVAANALENWYRA